MMSVTRKRVRTFIRHNNTNLVCRPFLADRLRCIFEFHDHLHSASIESISEKLLNSGRCVEAFKLDTG